MGAVDQFLRTIADAVRPDEKLGVAEWAAKYRILPENSPEPGKWRNERTPYLVGIMDALCGQDSTTTRYAHDDLRPFSNSWVTMIAQMKGHQIGGSSSGENFIGHAITKAAGNILAVFATKDDAEKWEVDRFEPMRTSTPELRSRVKDSGRKGSDNTKLRKRFPGGMLNLVSATKAGRLKSTTVRYVLLEEVDEYALNVDGQGNPIELAINRTSNYGRRAKIFANSTPTIKGRSQIERLYEKGDQRRYFVHCPECGHPQYFDWKNMRWTEGDPDSVLCHCEACGVGSAEHVWKTRGYEGAYWMPTAPGDGKTASFHISSLYAPIGWRPWAELVRDWIEAQTDVAKLIAFINNALGECWEDRTAEVKWEMVKRRAETHAQRTIPRGCLLLTAAVDVQKNRLEVEISGWGRGMTNWTIQHLSIDGDPSTPAPWAALDALLERPLVNAFGVSMQIQTCAIDSGGHHTQEVYDYCRLRQARGVFAVKGAKEAHRPIIGRPTQQDVTVRGRTFPKGVQLWQVGTDTAKDKIFSILQADEEADPTARRMRFPGDLDDEYYKQLVAEAFNVAKGRWDKLRPRNEALDLKVYNFAAAYHPRLRVNLMSESDWAALEVVLEPRVRDLFSQPAVDTTAAAAPAPVASAEPPPVQALPPAANPAPAQPVAAATTSGGWMSRRKNWMNR